MSRSKTTRFPVGVFPIIFVLSIIPVILLAQEKYEPLRLIHADVLKQEKAGEQTRQILQGNVKFRQGKTTIECDVATQLLNLNQAYLIGHVRIEDENRILLADTVFIDQNEKKQIANGHVINITEQDTTFADRMTYFEAEDKVLSEGNVRITNVKKRTVVTGGFAEYLRDKDYGRVLHEPVLVELDSLGEESMRIEADTMETFNSEGRTVATGNVTITQTNMSATCGQAINFEADGRILLLRQPKIIQKNQEISGDTLQLFFSDSQVERAVVMGNALATSDADTLNKGRWINRLTGKKMEFHFTDEKLEQVFIENQATSLYHIIEDDEYKGANEVTGDSMVIYISDDKAKQVLVKSNPDLATGKYTPPK